MAVKLLQHFATAHRALCSCSCQKAFLNLMFPVPHLQSVQLPPGGLPLVQHLQEGMRQVKASSLPKWAGSSQRIQDVTSLHIALSTDGKDIQETQSLADCEGGLCIQHCC